MKIRASILTLALLIMGSMVSSANARVVPIKIGSEFAAEDGRAWAALDSNAKSAYLKGFAFGFGMGGAVILKEYSLSADSDLSRAWMSLDEYNPKGDFARMAEYIDWVYTNPANTALRILDAYSSLAMMQNGDIEEEELGDYFKSMIAEYK